MYFTETLEMDKTPQIQSEAGKSSSPPQHVPLIGLLFITDLPYNTIIQPQRGCAPSLKSLPLHLMNTFLQSRLTVALIVLFPDPSILCLHIPVQYIDQIYYEVHVVLYSPPMHASVPKNIASNTAFYNVGNRIIALALQPEALNVTYCNSLIFMQNQIRCWKEQFLSSPFVCSHTQVSTRSKAWLAYSANCLLFLRFTISKK